MTKIGDFKVIRFTKENEDLYKDMIKNLKLKEMDLFEIKSMNSTRDIVINDILKIEDEFIYLVFIEQELIGVIGVKDIGSNCGYIYMTTTEDIYKHKIKFAKYTIDILIQLKEYYVYLYTYKNKNDKRGLKWLKYNGFEIVDKQTNNNLSEDILLLQL